MPHNYQQIMCDKTMVKVQYVVDPLVTQGL